MFWCAYGIFDPYGSFWYFLASVILHEGGHLLTLWLLKKKVVGIYGTPSGMEIQTVPLSYGEEMLVAATGPFVNLLLLILSIGRIPLLALINGLLLSYNLLPFFPFDGGRLLRSCLRSQLKFPLCDTIERIIGICSFILLFTGAVYLSFGLHSGLWPILFCGALFCKVGDVLFPRKEANP